jgi:hypothetical protein
MNCIKQRKRRTRVGAVKSEDDEHVDHARRPSQRASGPCIAQIELLRPQASVPYVIGGHVRAGCANRHRGKHEPNEPGKQERAEGSGTEG